MRGAVAFTRGKPANRGIARADGRLTVTLRPRMISERDPFGNKSERAVIGIRSDAPVYTAAGPVMALQASAAQTWEMVRLTGSILGQFVTGQRSIKDKIGRAHV